MSGIVRSSVGPEGFPGSGTEEAAPPVVADGEPAAEAEGDGPGAGVEVGAGVVMGAGAKAPAGPYDCASAGREAEAAVTARRTTRLFINGLAVQYWPQAF
jgi:hypothetical protein